MSDTRARLSKLASEHLGLDQELDFDAAFKDSGVTSMNAVAFYKEVNREFSSNMKVGDCLNIRSLGDLAEFLDK